MGEGDMNEDREAVTEGEKLELSGGKDELQCQATLELGESNSGVGEERNGAVSPEDKPVGIEGGEVDVPDNHDLSGELEIVTEPGGGDAATEEGCGGVIAAESEGLALQPKAEEETDQACGAEEDAAVADTGDAPTAIGESLVDSVVSGLLVDGLQNEKVEDEITPDVDSNLDIVSSDTGNKPPFSDVLIDARADETVEPQLEIKSEEESAPMHVPEGGNDQELPDVKLDELQAAEASDNKPEAGMDVENSEETTVEGDEVDEGKLVGVLSNEPEVGTAEKAASTKEEEPRLMITEDIPLSEGKSNADIIVTEANATEEEGVLDEDNADSNAKGEPTEDEKVAPNENLIFDTMVVEHEVTKEVFDSYKLDEPVNVPENLGDAVVKEEAPAGDIDAETKVEVGSELTEHVGKEEHQLRGPEVETETETKEAADEIHGSDGMMQTEESNNDVPDEDEKMETDETASDVDEPSQDVPTSPAGLQDEEEDTKTAEEDTGPHDTEMETETEIGDSGKASGGKRKRGKLSKSLPLAKTTPKSSSKKTAGEDVCFICFDGGELVLCDRRGCPKAYHPSCVNRDEAFFKSKGQWNCGWHLCSKCEKKNARYMCYTCTNSLCRNCIKDSVILCVRGNKGFCEDCMKTVKLIESSEQGKDVEIDFDDRSSWEFLFKDYYTELKDKLSLTSDEIAEAKNPWKGADISGPNKQELADANDGGSDSDDSVENAETISRPKRRKIRKQPKSLNKQGGLVKTGRAEGSKAIILSGGSGWATNELLEFVSHMRNGNTSVLTQFDVQALVLEYIKQNKLRDPHGKSHIKCDARLENLFGKPRVGHFEMLKLIESHFLVRDEQNDDVQGSVVDTENNQLVDIDGNADVLTKSVKDKKRKSRKKGGNRGRQSNLDDYAAIDMHNIGLIYLRRKLMEDLLEDPDMFHDKVIGTFVRIRIPGSTQKQEFYRLVQVVGTSKAPEPYKIGKKTTDIMVEILNLDKTETVSIDTISNQEFSEEECKRLRQSIKCGLISRLTVGEILDKTMELHAAKVNDWLESETLRLSHLCDRASDLGRRKELRECVEKLNLLKTPKERQRRLDEVPEIHADPKMDPSYESEDEDSEAEDTRRDSFLRSRSSSFNRRERGHITPGISDNSIKDSWGGSSKVSNKVSEPSSRNLSRRDYSINASHVGEIVNEKSRKLERERVPKEAYNYEKLSTPINSATARPESITSATAVASQPSSSSSEQVETAVKINESEKMWHYKDPSGKVQGPFSMVQLRKWNNTGYFPADLKIWKTTETQGNSVLLSDALDGKFPKETPAAVANILSAINTLRGSHTLAELAGKVSSVASLHQENERLNVDQNWHRNETKSLPSPTPSRISAGVEGDLPSVNGVLPTSSALLPNTVTHSATAASVLASVLQTAAATLSPTPNSQQGSMIGSAALPTSIDSNAVKIPSAVQPVQNIIGQNLQPTVQPIPNTLGQNLQADAQGWGGGTPTGQPQGYNWNSPNIQNPTGSLSNVDTPAALPLDVWKPPPTQGNQPNMLPPTATPNMPPPTALPNMPWGMGPLDNNGNVPWGLMPGTPNMGWINPANMIWGPGMQPPPTTGWVPPSGTPGADVMPGIANPGWAVSQSWITPPAQVPMPGNGWGGQPSGNPGGLPPPPPQGNTNQGPPQGWVAQPPPPPPAANQGSWHSDQNNSGNQFSGQRGGRGRGWNRQSSHHSRHLSKREKICPYNANGRCRKGQDCDFIHT